MDLAPTGTLTFLFTDIEGSTALWEQQPEAARDALIRHDALVEQIVAAHAGQVVRPRGEGDSRFAVFGRATDALVAACALQWAIHGEPWGTPTPLRVRIAIHTGEVEHTQDASGSDYYGSAVNRCARLRAVAHGGQILLSDVTQQLAREHLPAGVALHDLGLHRLKDLLQPEHIFELLVDGLPACFPPLKTLEGLRHNLPIQRTPLIGREREVAALVDLLRRPEVGLVTLTGPGAPARRASASPSPPSCSTILRRALGGPSPTASGSSHSHRFTTPIWLPRRSRRRWGSRR
jgi:class 3 adenylate cyclase